MQPRSYTTYADQFSELASQLRGRNPTHLMYMFPNGLTADPRVSVRPYSRFRGSPSTPRPHDPRPSTQPWRTHSRSPSSRICFNCGKPRHFANDCRAPRNKVHRARPPRSRTLTWPWLLMAWTGRPRKSPWPGNISAVPPRAT